MSDKVNSITVGELLAVISGVMALFYFFKMIIVPLFKKWLKIDSNEHSIENLKALPTRVEKLETDMATMKINSTKDLKEIQAIKQQNGLIMEALQALIRNAKTGNNKDKLEMIDNKIDGWFADKIRS